VTTMASDQTLVWTMGRHVVLARMALVHQPGGADGGFKVRDAERIGFADCGYHSSGFCRDGDGNIRVFAEHAVVGLDGGIQCRKPRQGFDRCRDEDG